VTAIWKLARTPAQAVLEVEPLTRLSAADQAAVTEEGERLLAFAADDIPDHDLRFATPGG
ncbi:MAG TPA: winged helix DNA-binding domain-containing protein, partial [Actinomycetota bacterium]|nr:winged helix DNA-binding domain-containing protein [Actinomycetota bacterium]